MTDCYIGIDTSCYTTSVAALGAKGNLLADCRRVLDVGTGSRGLRQSEMVFQHTRNLPALIEQAMETIGKARPLAIAASVSPCPGEQSYMPVFLAGTGAARAIAAVGNIPFVATSHQQNHVYAGLWSAGALDEKSILAVHLSGGTTDLLYVENDGQRMTLTRTGNTGDIAAGQFVDRLGVAMGLQFPAGRAMENMAQNGKIIDRYPVSVSGNQVSFSGWDTKLSRMYEKGEANVEDISATVFDIIGRSVIKMLKNGMTDRKTDAVMLAGGVAANRYITDVVEKSVLDNGLRFIKANPAYSSDNAVGCACCAMLCGR